MIFRGLKIEGDFLFYVLHVDGNGVVVVEPLCYLLGAEHRSVLAAGTPTPAVRGVVRWHGGGEREAKAGDARWHGERTPMSATRSQGGKCFYCWK